MSNTILYDKFESSIINSNNYYQTFQSKDECLLTIIMPVFNVSQYLDTAIISVLKSTLNDFHLVCIDDGSDDGSADILDSWSKRESRITVLHQENKGAGSARNKGHFCLNGQYTYFMDADDWIVPTLFEYTIHDLEKSGADVIAFNAKVTESNGYSYIEKRFVDAIITAPENKIPLIRHAEPWSKMWRTSFILENQLVWTDGQVSNNDNYFNWQGIVNARLALSTSEYFYNYCIRKRSLQRSHDQKHLGWAKINNDIKAFLKKSGHWDEYRTLYFRMKCHLGYYNKYQRLSGHLLMKFSKLMAATFCEDEIMMLKEHLLFPDCQEYYESIIYAYSQKSM
jgi:glycosyltransferase involved in cell wall biosynthesis